MKIKQPKDKDSRPPSHRQQSINPETTINHKELESLYRKEFELQVLQDKVNRSKPILETIYAKFKRKEERLGQSLKKTEKEMKNNSKMMLAYKELYQHGVKIMHRNRLVDLFEGDTNYRITQSNKENQPSEGRLKTERQQAIDKIMEKYGASREKLQKNRTLDKIMQKYGKKDKSSIKITKQQIYKKYKQKLGEQQSPARSNSITAKQLSKKLLEQADSDLKRMASRSMLQPKKQTINDKLLKQRYLILQQQKLRKL